MGQTLVPVVPQINFSRAHVLEEEFYWYTDAQLWTKLVTDAGTSVAWTAGAGGLVLLTTGATDNNEVAIATTNAVFTPATNKPFNSVFYFQYAEAATDDANVAVGFSSGMNVANVIADDGGAPHTATNTACFIYKVDGGTVWKCLTQVGTAQTISTSTKTAGGTAQAYAQINILPTADSKWEVEFRVDDKPLLDSTTYRAIKHSVTLTGVVAMKAGVYVKAGGATSETLKLDKVSVAQVR